MTLNQIFLSDSSTLSLESLNAVALIKLVYYISQRYVIFTADVPQSFPQSPRIHNDYQTANNHCESGNNRLKKSGSREDNSDSIIPERPE
jgi:hypothetical protein